MIYEPRELASVRAHLAEHLESERAETFVASIANQWITEGSAPSIVAADRDAIRTAEAFHIAPTMVDLLMQAKDGIGDAGFMDYDLPCASGLAYLAKPIPLGVHDRANVLAEKWLELKAQWEEFPEDERPDPGDLFAREWLPSEGWDEHLLILWLYRAPDAEHLYGSVHLSFHMERTAWTAWSKAIYRSNGQDKDAILDELARTLPAFVYDGDVVLSCSPEAAEVTVERHDGADEGGHWRHIRPDIFRALCYLLRQRIAQETVQQPDRPTRRRLAREGREAAPVRVISIRGASASGGGDGSREYVHRWIVRGHWRRQWYPSIGQNRPIWITPYVKGPDDAPLLGGEKVYSVKAMS